MCQVPGCEAPLACSVHGGRIAPSRVLAYSAHMNEVYAQLAARHRQMAAATIQSQQRIALPLDTSRNPYALVQFQDIKNGKKNIDSYKGIVWSNVRPTWQEVANWVVTQIQGGQLPEIRDYRPDISKCYNFDRSNKGLRCVIRIGIQTYRRWVRALTTAARDLALTQVAYGRQQVGLPHGEPSRLVRRKPWPMPVGRRPGGGLGPCLGRARRACRRTCRRTCRHRR